MMMMLLSRSVASSKNFQSSKKYVSNSFLRKYYSSSSCAVEELPLPYSSPLLMLPPEYITPNNEETLGSHNDVNFHFFSPTENKFMKLSNRKLPLQISPSVYRMSSNGWLACVNRRDCRLYLLNLFSSSDSPQIIPLPPIETLFHVRRFERNPPSKASMHFLVYSDVHCNRLSMESPSDLASTILNRIALSSDPNKDVNCTVMICHNEVHALSFCRIGDFAWTSLKKRVEPYEDIVYSKKVRLFYTTNNDKVEGWDLNNPSSPRRIITNIKFDYGQMESLRERQAEATCFHKSSYLVESPEGDILYVNRYYSRIAEDGSLIGKDDDPFLHVPYRTNWFAVYKFDFGKKRMYRVQCMGDTVLFVSRSEAFSVSASDYPGLKPNSIYFDDDAFLEITLSDCAGHDTGVFYFEEKTVTPLYQPFELKKIMPAPLWIFPKP